MYHLDSIKENIAVFQRFVLAIERNVIDHYFIHKDSIKQNANNPVIINLKCFHLLGYANGCKIGVTSPTGEKLLTTTIYPFRGNQHLQVEDWCKDHNARTLREIVHKYR